LAGRFGLRRPIGDGYDTSEIPLVRLQMPYTSAADRG
jgi:hypothetical protein